MLRRIKNFPVVRFFYRLTPLRLAYHFCLSFLAALVYGFPSKKIFVIGVTGTKGKTTVLELINAILESAGKKTALLSSLYFKIDDERMKNLTDNTMPGRLFVQKFLKKAVAKRCGYALLEVTSEGIRYFRHKFISWNLAVATNIAPEHIESHGSFEKYRSTKLSFLKAARKSGAKVFLNADDSGSKFFSDHIPPEDIVFYSTKTDMLASLAAAPKTGEGAVGDHLFKEFNRENIAAAIAVAKHLGVPEKNISQALENFHGMPGRMDVVGSDPFRAIVDYAHTPESLEKFYGVVRDETSGGRMICILGSAGGGRDKWKRPAMGRIADKYCEKIFLTNEDPYNEDPDQIIADVAEGVEDKNKISKVIDRKAAMVAAIDFAKPGDSVVITGKGSEPYIHVANGERILWSDREKLKEVFDEKKLR